MFKSISKRVRLASLVCALGTAGLVAATAAPAAAQGAGAGAVAGSVSLALQPLLSGTTPQCLTGCPDAYAFNSFDLVGALGGLAGTSPGVCAGTFAANAAGGDAAENVLATYALGTVNGNFYQTGGVGNCAGNFNGSFVRVGPKVLVVLNLTVNGSVDASGPLVVSAVFVPTNGNGVNSAVTSADFAGAFVGAGA